MPSTEYINERRAMTREQLAGRGIANKAVLRAFMNVPRHRFVPPKNQPNAYEDRPLNIGCGQTISQPYMVALMTDILSPMPSHNVLEVGAGSGYQAAILAELAHEVVTIERCPALAAQAERRLAALGYGNVRVLLGDGTAGAPGYGPFDRIVVTAGGPAVPDALKRQLRPGHDLDVMRQVAHRIAQPPPLDLGALLRVGRVRRHPRVVRH